MQTVESGGTASSAVIENGGLMQNAGEDTGTTVKDGGVYELGRYSFGSPDNPLYGYNSTASASDLTVEAGGRATVYAGTLTGATVSGANASLTLMTPRTRADGSDLTLSLKGQVSVTEGDRLVVTGTAEGNHRVYVANTGVSPSGDTPLTLVTTGGGDASFVLGNEGGTVDVGTYEYTLKKDTDNPGGNSWSLTEYVAPDTPDTPDTPVPPPSDVSKRITPSTAAVLSMAAVTPLVWDTELESVREQHDNPGGVLQLLPQ